MHSYCCGTLLCKRIMYEFFLGLHSHLRWLLLGLAVITTIRYVWGYFAGKALGSIDNRIGLVYVAILHTQLLLGLILYFFLSPVTITALPEGWIKVAALRFQVLEHPLLMCVAVVLAQIGRSLSKKAKEDRKKFARGALFYAISLLLLLLGIPWSRIS